MAGGRLADAGDGAGADALHARLLDGFAALLAELGGDMAAVARAAGLGPGAAGYRATAALLEAGAAALGRPDLGLRLARRQGGAVLGPLSHVMRHAGTFAEALRYVSDHNQAHSPAARIWIERADGGALVGHDLLLPGAASWTQAIEQIQLLGHLGALDMTGGRARARRVHFRHPPLSPPRLYGRQFGCEVRFGADEDGIFFADADLAAPVVRRDPRAWARATTYIASTYPARARPLHAEGRGQLMRLIGAGPCRAAEVAGRLALHVRTLHRRLEAEGVTFQQGKDALRRDLLTFYLARTDLDLGAISGRLGFAEQAVLTRFCRRQFACAPSALRARDFVPIGQAPGTATAA